MKIANLTVAIATLDRPRRLTRCLDALLSGTILPAEIIIVDQSQHDATQTIVAKRLGGPVPIVYIRQHRRGLAASRNAAIARASCPIIAVTDDDCVPYRGWLAAIERAFVAIPAPDAVTGRVLPLGADKPGTYPVSVRDSTRRADYTGKVIPWFVGTGGNFAAKGDWLNRIGGYDKRLGAGSPGKAGEDADLFYRLLCAGARIRYEPGAVVLHERQNKDRRMTSSWSYGYGNGAFCSIRLRQADLYAFYILGHWLLYQCATLARAAGCRRWTQVAQRLLSLRGTVRGLIYGLRVGRMGRDTEIAPDDCWNAPGPA